MKVDFTEKTEDVVVSLSDKFCLEVSTPDGSVRFDKESGRILKFLAETGIVSPMFMLEMLGGASYLRGLAEKYDSWADFYEDMRRKWKS